MADEISPDTTVLQSVSQIEAKPAASLSGDHGDIQNESNVRSPLFAGFVEIYGRHEAAECLIVGGWGPRTWTPDTTVTAVFQRGSASASAQVALFEREDLGARGVGFILLLRTPYRRLGRLLRLILSDREIELPTTTNATELSEALAVKWAGQLLPACLPGPGVAAIRTLLARRFVGEGFIETHGYHASSRGWFFCGWISNDWIAEGAKSYKGVARFEGGECEGVTILNFRVRDDIQGRGLGFIVHITTDYKRLGPLLTLTLIAGDAVAKVKPADVAGMLPSTAVAINFNSLIANSDPGPAREELRSLVSRPDYSGRDTLETLAEKILMGVDETIVCAADSVVLTGWLLAKPGAVKAIRLRSSDRIFPIDIDTNLIGVRRQDVIDAVGREHGFDDPRCGFLVRAPTGEHIDGEVFLEIETTNGEIGFKVIPRSKLDGIAAIKRILEGLETQYSDIDAIYDHVVGPAIQALNAQRLRAPTKQRSLQFGAPVSQATHSLIIPLYGRIDFLELQMALFAIYGLGDAVEVIYVLDDPPRTRDAQLLASSVYERFRVPFRLLCLERNVGFGPASNIGMRASTGKYVCFMNSDVFPTDGDWLERLGQRLDDDPSLGVVGPMLLFEDDSVQHQGIYFIRLHEFGNWAFAQHRRKGFRIPAAGGLAREVAITGACMLLRREDCIDCGGFDEAFVIGDFEDTDLCLRLRKKGLGASVDLGVRLHHLERKSQASSASSWRMNLTLYNAWLHQRRWSETLSPMLEAK